MVRVSRSPYPFELDAKTHHAVPNVQGGVDPVRVRAPPL